jgi:transposase-like protein
VSEHRSDSKSFEVFTANPVRLSSSPARSYRAWSDEEKARIVGETLVAGANVSAIARSNGLDPSQLFTWRRKAMASGVVILKCCRALTLRQLKSSEARASARARGRRRHSIGSNVDRGRYGLLVSLGWLEVVSTTATTMDYEITDLGLDVINGRFR